MTTITLEFPLQHGEQLISELTFRRPKYKEVKGKKFSDLENFTYTVELTSILTGYPLSIFENLDYADLFKCAKVLTDFFAELPTEKQFRSLAVLFAINFHWSPKDIYKLTADEMEFWLEGLREHREQQEYSS